MNSETKQETSVALENVVLAQQALKEVIVKTPLMENINLSHTYDANIFLKREDLQVVRSYKIRGAYNKIHRLSKGELDKGIICASAGNHAQGVAFACQKLGILGKIYMPSPTPSQKIKQVQMFGKEYVEIVLTGDTYDDAYNEAKKYAVENDLTFVHPFNDLQVIEGQATVGLEILNDTSDSIDYLFLPIGGGGLASGVSSVFKNLSPTTKIIGVEPEGAPAMKVSIEKGAVTTLEQIDKFVDGAAVKEVGALTFKICKENLHEVITVPEGKVCTTILRLYNEEAIVVEPAGALTITALDLYKEKIKGKNVVCVVSGSNNDITRTAEIKERSMLYEGLKHYFMIRFAQRAGALREFLMDVLGSKDDITLFEYSKKNNRESGPALIGLVLEKREDFDDLIARMKSKNIKYEYLNNRQDLFQYLI